MECAGFEKKIRSSGQTNGLGVTSGVWRSVWFRKILGHKTLFRTTCTYMLPIQNKNTINLE